MEVSRSEASPLSSTAIRAPSAVGCGATPPRTAITRASRHSDKACYGVAPQVRNRALMRPAGVSWRLACVRTGAPARLPAMAMWPSALNGSASALLWTVKVEARCRNTCVVASAEDDIVAVRFVSANALAGGVSHERLPSVDPRVRVGLWEDHTIVGEGLARPLTLVDRKSGLARVRKVAKGKANTAMRAVLSALHPLHARAFADLGQTTASSPNTRSSTSRWRPKATSPCRTRHGSAAATRTSMASSVSTCPKAISTLF